MTTKATRMLILGDDDDNITPVTAGVVMKSRFTLIRSRSRNEVLPPRIRRRLGIEHTIGKAELIDLDRDRLSDASTRGVARSIATLIAEHQIISMNTIFQYKFQD